MLRFVTSVSLLSGALFLANAAQAQITSQVSCGQPVVSQQQQSGSSYSVTLTRTCRISGAAGRYQALQSAMVSDLVSQAASSGGRVLSGPQATSYNAGGQSLSAQYLRADIIRTTASGDRLSVLQGITVATDGRSVFVTDSQSERVQGSGNSRFVRRVSSRFKISGVGGAYTVFVSNQTTVEKPFFAPSDFARRVQSSVSSEIVRSSDRLLNGVVARSF